MIKQFFSLAIAVLMVLAILACNKDDELTKEQTETCDLSLLTVSATEAYDFSSNFSNRFSQSPRWKSYDADITLVDGKGQLTANADNTEQALEAWKLYKKQMPYNEIIGKIPSY